ncbi:class F sortase, partial [Acetobacteraceae bacterium]|nr:class F sortase [Candidatus Parcubacteria bacterium]
PEEEIVPSFASSSPPVVTIEGKPVRLIIPGIMVDASVQDVGIALSGHMAVPTNYSDVGWYRYGAVPGELGSAVIDGHVNNGFGLEAVFADLKELKKGDDIYVEDAKGSRVYFIVEEVLTYDKNEVPTDRLFHRQDAAYLNLITCSGTFNAQEDSYDSRTVVWATLAS